MEQLKMPAFVETGICDILSLTGFIGGIFVFLDASRLYRWDSFIIC